MNYEMIAKLLERAQKGEQEAVGLLYDEIKGWVYRQALQILKDENDAADVVQEISVKVLENVENLENLTAFPKWLYTTTINECRQMLRRDKKDVLTAEGDSFFEPFAYDETEFDLIMQQELRSQYLSSTMGILPEKQRRVVQLFYYERMSIKEIALAENVPVGTIKSRLSLARKKMKVAFEAEERMTNTKILDLFTFKKDSD